MDKFDICLTKITAEIIYIAIALVILSCLEFWKEYIGQAQQIYTCKLRMVK